MKYPTDDQSDNVLTYWSVNNAEREYDRPVGGELVVTAVRVPSGNVVRLLFNPSFILPAQPN